MPTSSAASAILVENMDTEKRAAAARGTRATAARGIRRDPLVERAVSMVSCFLVGADKGGCRMASLLGRKIEIRFMSLINGAWAIEARFRPGFSLLLSPRSFQFVR